MQANSHLELAEYLLSACAAPIAFSRLYLYVHFPTDILGSALLGVLTGWVCFSVLRFVFRRRTHERRNRKCC